MARGKERTDFVKIFRIKRKIKSESSPEIHVKNRRIDCSRTSRGFGFSPNRSCASLLRSRPSGCHATLRRKVPFGGACVTSRRTAAKETNRVRDVRKDLRPKTRKTKTWKAKTLFI